MEETNQQNILKQPFPHKTEIVASYMKAIGILATTVSLWVVWEFRNSVEAAIFIGFFLFLIPIGLVVFLFGFFLSKGKKMGLVVKCYYAFFINFSAIIFSYPFYYISYFLK